MKDNASQGTEMLHITFNEKGRLEIMNAAVPFENIGLMKLLLRTNRPGACVKDTDETGGYVFTFDNNKTKPYPDVMIFRFVFRDGGRILTDMTPGDMDIVPYAVRSFLE